MKASELKIGNYLLKDGIVVKIDARTIFDIWDDEGLKKYEPIPLTEQWLLRLGFVSNPYRDRFELEGIYIECDKTKGRLYLWESRTGVCVNYIHQIQNLYFVLTGEELTF